MFICFWNQHGKPEFAIQRTKHAKNNSETPQSKKQVLEEDEMADHVLTRSSRRPRNSISEGYKEEPLYLDSLLFTLPKLLKLHAFRDYNTIESLLDIIPPKDINSYHIAWREDVLKTPFCSSASDMGAIEKANAFHRRLTEAGVRACLPEPLTIHDWRANALFLIGNHARVPHISPVLTQVFVDKYYSQSDRMRAAAHDNANTFAQSYQSRESRVDGQSTFLGND